MPRAIVLLAVMAAVAVAAWVPVGPDGGSVAALAVSPGQPTTLVSLLHSTDTLQPVYRTTDAGGAWEAAGSVPYLALVVIDPFDPLTVYGSDGGGAIRRSTDGGATWRSASVPFYGQALGCDPYVPGRVYAAGGVYDTITLPMFSVSTDHGESWSSSLVADDTGYIYSLEVSPVVSGVIFLGGDYGMVYRSTDCGLTWEPRSNGLSPDNYVLALSASHADAGLVCAGTVSGVFRTTDTGGSWHQAGGPQYVMSVDMSPVEPARGYASGYDTGSACYSTTDAGASWQRVSSITSSVSLGGVIADAESADGVWCGTSAGVVKSTDGGRTWNPRSAGIHSAVITTVSVPGWNRERVYAAVEGVGVHKSSDAGQTWERCTDFLACGNICGIGLGQGTGGDRLYALEGSG